MSLPKCSFFFQPFLGCIVSTYNAVSKTRYRKEGGKGDRQDPLSLPCRSENRVHSKQVVNNWLCINKTDCLLHMEDWSCNKLMKELDRAYACELPNMASTLNVLVAGDWVSSHQAGL